MTVVATASEGNGISGYISFRNLRTHVLADVHEMCADWKGAKEEDAVICSRIDMCVAGWLFQTSEFSR